MIIFRVGADDAKVLEKEFAPEFIPEDFVGLPNYQIYLKMMIDGITSRPFSANTLPPIKVSSNFDSTEKVINSSRRHYSRPTAEVEAAINSWSSTAGGTTVGVVTNRNTPMFPAVCINCEKNIMVPFEPIASKPIYCKECLNKIKVGEIKPVKGYYDKNQTDGPKPAEALAMLGIEYNSDLIRDPKSKTPYIDKFDTKKSNTNNYSLNTNSGANTFKTNNYTKKINTSNSTTPKIDTEKENLLKESKDKKDPGFTTLKDLLTNITGEKNIEPKKPDAIISDPKKVTLHPIVPEIKKEVDKNNTPKPNNITTTKFATKESQDMLKNLMSNALAKPAPKSEEKVIAKIEDKVIIEPVKTQAINVDTIKESKEKEKTTANPAIELKNITENSHNIPAIQPIEIPKENEIPVPLPPKAYQKRTPKEEVPEEVLRSIFEEDPNNKAI